MKVLCKVADSILNVWIKDFCCWLRFDKNIKLESPEAIVRFYYSFLQKYFFYDFRDKILNIFESCHDRNKKMTNCNSNWKFWCTCSILREPTDFHKCKIFNALFHSPIKKITKKKMRSFNFSGFIKYEKTLYIRTKYLLVKIPL